MRPRSLLLALTGLAVDGGIASVNRSVATALDECLGDGRLERADRVLLYDRPGAAAPPTRGEQLFSRGSQARFLWQTWQLARRHRPDLVFYDHVGVAQASQLPLPGLAGRAYDIFTHGTELEPAQAGLRRRALLGARHILTNSEFTARSIRSRFAVRDGQVRAVPLCIDPSLVQRWEKLEAADAPAPRREAAALIVGRMLAEERGKGHDALLEAWTRVRERFPQAALWVVGGGDDRARLEGRARELGLGGAVQFLGRISDEELMERYRRARVFVMPSRQEGFGLVYAEAMFHGLPCIGSRADAAGEVIRDGETGRLVPYADVAALAEAVCWFLENPEAAERLGEAGRRDVRARFLYPRFRADLLGALGLAGEAA